MVKHDSTNVTCIVHVGCNSTAISMILKWTKHCRARGTVGPLSAVKAALQGHLSRKKFITGKILLVSTSFKTLIPQLF